jgi:transcriptional regulator
MYLPDLFAITDPQEAELVLSSARLGCLITRDAEGFFGTHLPMLYDPERRLLSGHVARANPHPERSGDGEALVVFQGLDAYVTPNWYPSKFKHGRVVPTWNYEVAHVTGTLSWRPEAAWLRAHLEALTQRFERAQAKPWALSDAPEDYLQKQFAAVVGVELQVREVKVKRKLSQNRTPADRMGVAAGLLDSDDPGARRLGERMSGQ